MSDWRCREMRAQAPRLQNAISPEERDVLRLAGESVAAAALCLMSGHHDCPLYIAVNVEKLIYEYLRSILSDSVLASLR